MALSKIAKNIRTLRKGHGESREDLAEAINVSPSAIGNYETDFRSPDIQKLTAIADHYGFPVDRLISDDFTNIDFKFTNVTWETATAAMEVQFPLLCSEEAMQNKNFAEGYRRTLDIWGKIKEAYATITSEYSYSPLEFYEKAYDENNNIAESIANILWVVFINYALLPDEHSIKMGEAIIHGKAASPDFVKEYVLKDSNPISKENQNNKKAYVADSQEMIVELLKLLKRTQYSDLADYYMALRYAICMVDNDYTDELNKTMGVEMLTACASLGNQYAINYFKVVQRL